MSLTKKKNIWILNHYAIPFEGRHYKFSANLNKRGYNVKVFVASTKHNKNENKIIDKKKYLYEVYNNIPFIFIKARNYIGNGRQRIFNMIDYAMGLLAVSKKFDAEKPDIIYASSVHPLTWLSGYRLAKKYKAKFIAETRDLWPETLVAMGRINRHGIVAKSLYKIEKFIYKNADKLIFTFPGGKDYVEGIGLDASKVSYINNGVDLSEFNQNKTTYIFNDSYLEDESIFKIVYTGSMGKANALIYLIESAKIIQDKGIEDIKFILFGEGYQKNELKKYVEDNKITNVIFEQLVEKKYIPYILSKSRLNIFTGQNIYLYRYGLSLNKMFDYFASGKPTLSNMECEYDIIKQYNCGETVKGGSAGALAEGILKFYNMSGEEYKSYCDNALKAAKDFDFELLTNKLEKIMLEN